jgi:hypothetical protein
MGEPTPHEIHEAELASEAAAKKYMLVKHIRYSLMDRSGTERPDFGPVDDLEEVGEFLRKLT